MSEPDLNLLIALDALISEASVAGAARRLGLSASAMSRTLTRLRQATGDQLLVRAGRQMVLTPAAEGMRERTRNVVHEARTLLRPSAPELSLASLERDFVLRPWLTADPHAELPGRGRVDELLDALDAGHELGGGAA